MRGHVLQRVSCEGLGSTPGSLDAQGPGASGRAHNASAAPPAPTWREP